MHNLDTMTESATRSLAGRFSRRSLLANVGKGGMVLSLGGIGVAALPDDAQAHLGCPCASCSHSVTCYDLTGSNSCPSGTDGCGWWAVCASPCTYRKVWSDCCSLGAACDNPSCVGGAPTCYLHKTWSCGCCSGSAHIKCRRWYCSGGNCTDTC